jgi:NitT/TauT family transport system substrate-binding protein
MHNSSLKTRRDAVKFGLLGMASGPLTFPAAALAQAQPVAVKAAYQAVASCANFFVAKEKNFFAAEGVDLSASAVASNIIVQAVAAGQYALGVTDIVQVTNLVLKGSDLKIIYPAALVAAEHPYALVLVPSGSPIKSAKDLAGKTIGVHSLQSYVDATLKAWLKGVGVDPASVRFLPVGFAGIVPAVRSKQVDATFALEPQAATMLREGIATVLGAPTETLGTHLAAGYIASESWLDKNPAVARGLVRALDRATEWLIANPSELAGVVSRNCNIAIEVANEMRMPGLVRVARMGQTEKLSRALAEYGVVERYVSPCDLFSKYCPKEGC